MATAWKVAAATAVLGWLVAPVITLLLPKILSRLGFDTSKKLRELEFNIIPELKKTLHVVDQERMLGRGLKDSDDVAVLDKMAAMLRRAREEAQDSIDDHQEIELYRNTCSQRLYGAMKACPGIILSGWTRVLQWTRTNSCLQHLYGAAKACIACCLAIARIVKSGSARLLQRTRNFFKEPAQVNASATASHNHVGVTIDAGVSHEEPVSEATTSYSASIPVTAPSCSSFDVFKNHCRSIFYWLVDGFVAAHFYRDWSYEVLGLTSNKENATGLDYILTAVSRMNLKKRIENVESTISEVQKSPLLDVASKIAPEDIADKNRSKVRTPSNRKVFGREALRDSIMAKLREKPYGTGPCYSVIGIYGVAGSGKTTFARYIRDFIEEECKEEKLFHTIMCIHVSETFSAKDIFHEMLKDITKDRHSNISDREDLEEKLKESLRGKRFCLILDDLWVKTKNDPQLEELIFPLNVGLKGSKILVTSRTIVAARALCADEPTEMPDLDVDQYLSMFMHYAMGDTSVTGEEFKQVGRLIAEKLHGSPIAAVIVAGQLGANRNISFWENTAKLDMLNGTMDALWWSYQQLSPDIKRCFEYCNMFPRRFKMKKSDLVHLWIAQGFVKTSCAREEMEDVAEGYIQELVSCSFLQPERTWDDVECFRIHDLLHELADMVTRTDSFRIENKSNQRGECSKGDIRRDVRHIFIQNYDAELISEEIFGFRHLRTLIINDFEGDTQVEEKMMENICMKLPELRVLAFYLSNESIKKRNKFSFPESIRQLKYLRYLAFRANIGCKITLPSTINKLHHIQVLDFGYGKIAEFTFAEFVNLRHIFCGPYVKLAYVGRMNSLQTLPDFNVSNEQGCELKQLRDLNKLQGKLCIGGLENVKSKVQALQANLTAKECLTQLSLWWISDNDTRCSREVEADVLEGLCPPVGLKILGLWNFAGCRYPDWMVGKHSRCPKYLQELRLFSCSKPGPASGLAEAFPHLHVIRIFVCSWDALPSNIEHLTSLKELLIYSCKNIRSLPTLPQSLEKLYLQECDVEFMKSCQTVGHPNWQNIEHIPSKLFC